MTVGDVVNYARNRAKVSARQLSARAGLSASYVTKLEAGEIEPSLHAFSRIAGAVRMSDQEIVFCVRQESLRETK